MIRVKHAYKTTQLFFINHHFFKNIQNIIIFKSIIRENKAKLSDLYSYANVKKNHGTVL